MTLNGVVGEVVKSRPLVRLKNLLRWPMRLRVFQGFVGREIGFSLLCATFGVIWEGVISVFDVDIAF